MEKVVFKPNQTHANVLTSENLQLDKDHGDPGGQLDATRRSHFFTDVQSFSNLTHTKVTLY